MGDTEIKTSTIFIPSAKVITNRFIRTVYSLLYNLHIYAQNWTQI